MKKKINPISLLIDVHRIKKSGSALFAKALKGVYEVKG